MRTIVYWGLYWGPPVLGNYRMEIRAQVRGMCEILQSSVGFSVGLGLTAGVKAQDLMSPLSR